MKRKPVSRTSTSLNPSSPSPSKAEKRGGTDEDDFFDGDGIKNYEKNINSKSVTEGGKEWTESLNNAMFLV